MKHVDNRNLHDLIHEVTIPMETVTEVTDSGAKTVERKVFPGYVLIKMVMTDETLASWCAMSAVSPALSAPATTRPSPSLTRRSPPWAWKSARLWSAINVGDNVKITDGALESFLGTVEEIDLDRSKVRVVVSMFGRETPVELELDQVEPVQD